MHTGRCPGMCSSPSQRHPAVVGAGVCLFDERLLFVKRTNDDVLVRCPPRVVPRLQSTLLPTMAALFELPVSRLLAREVFVVKYSADAGGQPSLPLHRDKYSLSFNVLLSDPAWFEGGGTRLESLGVTVRPVITPLATDHLPESTSGGGGAPQHCSLGVAAWYLSTYADARYIDDGIAF